LKKQGLIIFFILCVLFSFGCATSKENNENKDTGEAPQNTEQPKSTVNISETIYDQWQGSAHAKAIDAEDPAAAPGMREEGNCFFCHNGYAFENNVKDLKGIGILKGTSCDTCHVGYGHELISSGKANVPLGTIQGGKGSVCSACHNGRGKKPDKKSAPHHSVQLDMILGKSGSEVSGVSYTNSAHTSLPDSCLACHMAEDKNGLRDHTYKMAVENIDNTCNKCHEFDSFNPEAKGDYDGNGKKEGVQTEITGLLKLVNDKIREKLNGGKFESVHGSIKFTDASGKALETPPDEKIYGAAWNYFFVDYDGSKGIHNTKYAVQLLQQSYKDLTGEDVPKAEILK